MSPRYKVNRPSIRNIVPPARVSGIVRFRFPGGFTMSRHLFSAATCLLLSACVYQMPAQPYSRAYYPPAYPANWYPPQAPRMAYAPPPQGPYPQSPASYAPPSYIPPSGMPGPYMPAARKPAEPSPPAAMDPAPSRGNNRPPEWSPQSGSDSPAPRRGAGATFAEETVDYGVPPTNTLHLANFDAPTPTHIQGAARSRRSRCGV